MSILTKAPDIRANGRDAIEALRGTAQHFTQDNLPKIAAAAEDAGASIADFALSSSRSLARSLRDHAPTRKDAEQLLARAAPAARAASGFAMRNPALMIAGGIAVGVLGYIAWRSVQAEEPATPAPRRRRRKSPATGN